MEKRSYIAPSDTHMLRVFEAYRANALFLNIEDFEPLESVLEELNRLCFQTFEQVQMDL